MSAEAGIASTQCFDARVVLQSRVLPPPIQSAMPPTCIDPLPSPLLPANPQMHSQARYHLLFLSAPFGSAKQPVCQRNDSSGSVGAVIFIGMLNRMRCDSSFGIKGEYEHARELVAFAQIEDQFVSA